MLTDMLVWVCPSKKYFKISWFEHCLEYLMLSTAHTKMVVGTNLIKLSRDDVIGLIHWELESLLSH